MTYNIRDYGAVSDGKTMNTVAINNAVRACARNGGGQVVVPAGGVFMTGTIWLQSHVELHLEHGAVLKASGDFRDYCEDDAYTQNYGSVGEEWTGSHLIVALECEDVSITGTGVIDGNTWAFISMKDVRRSPGDPYAWSKGYRRAKRPGQAIAIIESKNVRVAEITMRDIPTWALFLHGCEYVQIQGVSIINYQGLTNNDGIDIDACQYVTVSDCLVDTGDDAIAIRNASHRLKNKNRICQYITITNCSLASRSSVFRLGVGKGELRHIRVSNLTVHHGHVLINFCTEWASVCRTPLYDINFSYISATNVGKPVVIDTKIGVEVQNVTLENISCEARAGLWLKSEKPGALKDITLRNVDVFLNDDDEYRPEWLKYRGEYAVEARNVEGLILDRVRVSGSEKELKKWEGKFHEEGCSDLITRDCRL